MNKKCGYVALIGAPNAGKSTLLNQFVGTKVSIVSPKVQTTRTLVKGIGIHNNTQIIFIDTPGIFKPKGNLEKTIVSNAWNGVKDADISVLLVDAKKGIDDNTRNIISKLNNRRVSVLLNKIDLVQKDKLLGLAQKLNELYPFEQTFFASALKGEHLEDFYNYLADNLPDSPWYYDEDQISDLPTRLLIAEIIREKAFLYLQQELPYSIIVEPESFERKEDNSIKANMTIYVQRDNQKSIVLGKGGSMIKKIGQSARKEIENLLEEKVHLFLFVKVKENWSDNLQSFSVFNDIMM
ncbi:MAG: GTPase Era [Alphaproteobacteria bacterium]